MLTAFESAGALGLGNDADADTVVGALRKVSGLIVDPATQRTLTDSACAGGTSPDHTSSHFMFSPSSSRMFRDGGGGGGDGMGRPSSAGHGQSFTTLFALLSRYAEHALDRVAAAALQAITDGVTHLNWGGAVPSPVAQVGPGGALSAVSAEGKCVASALVSVTRCLEREPLRRAVRLLFSAVIAKLGPRFAVDSLVACGQHTSKVRGGEPAPQRAVHGSRDGRCWGV